VMEQFINAQALTEDYKGSPVKQSCMDHTLLYEKIATQCKSTKKNNRDISKRLENVYAALGIDSKKFAARTGTNQWGTRDGLIFINEKVSTITPADDAAVCGKVYREDVVRNQRQKAY